MIRWTPIAAVVLLSGCLFEETPEVVRFSGKTMGTTYNITAIGVDLDEEALSASIEATLKDVNGKMSNWDPESEVSTFSKSTSTLPQTVSADFAKVMSAAGEVHVISGGQFDVTLGPLIELWGFGPRKPEDPIPSDEAINEALAGVGQARLLDLDPAAPSLAKAAPEVGINLSAIAKGFGIDAVSAVLQDAGIENFMVEIGGDLFAEGKNDKGDPWRIGIETPEAGGQGGLELIVPVSNTGMATSGDYRNFFEQDGIRYSHIIDPTTGRPITHRTTSVTVLAENGMLADAWATAMLVLGQERGMKIANDHNLAVFFISRSANADAEDYITTQSDSFAAAQSVD
ncbi:FAD:protein FMN transferase [Shimia thalassica]|uniref:FAD:protein FMN transferase n=1 Tax=Shimia thalassica TaxID=1715693 RepID=UPI002736D6D0|nr:FAD:protein FMN transferase [Shimia thalassica]MDP2496128.1 FAD:protein FMN transferase [Shimia thalassica]MDP2581971.1 FAD:protein FMN transferase [Shimia thalassica]